MIKRNAVFKVGYRYRAKEADGWVTVVCRSPVDTICDLCIIEGVDGVFAFNDHRDFPRLGEMLIGDTGITLDQESGEPSPETLPSADEAFAKFMLANAISARRKLMSIE